MKRIRPGSLEDRLQFETLISDISSRFVNVPPGEVDGAIEDTLRRVCEFLAIDLGVLWQWRSTDLDSLMPTHAYASGKERFRRPPSRCITNSIRGSSSRSWKAAWWSSRRSTHFRRKPRSTGRARRPSGSSRISLFRLALAGELPVGALAFNTVLAERDWPDSVVMRLQLVAQVLTNALARSRHDEQRQWSKARLAAGAQLAGLGFYEVNLEHGTADVSTNGFGTRVVCPPTGK